jgi:hypothetical protein
VAVTYSRFFFSFRRYRAATASVVSTENLSIFSFFFSVLRVQLLSPPPSPIHSTVNSVTPTQIRAHFQYFTDASLLARSLGEFVGSLPRKAKDTFSSLLQNRGGVTCVFKGNKKPEYAAARMLCSNGGVSPPPKFLLRYISVPPACPPFF